MVDSFKSVPAGLMRTLVTVAETASLAQTSRRLNISPTVVSAQIARLEKILGGPLIESDGGRRVTTERGRLVLEAARRALAKSKTAPEPRERKAQEAAPVRIGVSSLFIEKFASAVDALADDEMLVSSSVCTELVSSFVDRRLDEVLVLDVLDQREKLQPHLVDEHGIDFAWVQTRDFESDPARAIPLAVWPGDGLALRTLDKAKTDYKTMFASNDYFAKLSAVRSGRYISMMPRNTMREPFVEADDARLPSLPTTMAMIAVRGDRQTSQMQRIAAALATAHLM